MRRFILCVIFVFVVFSGKTQDSLATNNSDSDTAIVVQSDSIWKLVIPPAILTDQANQSNSTAEDPEEVLEPPSVSEFISVRKIFWSIIFVLIGYFGIRFITQLLGFFAEKSTHYRITLKGLIPIIRIFGWLTIIFIVVAGIFRPPFETVIAVTASIGIAVGFASQDILKNIFGGIMILFDRPFQVGDKIEVGSHYGEVLEIGLRSTRIVTPDDSIVSIPNGEIMNQSVSNANSGETNCQVVAEVYLPIDIDTERVRQIAMESAQVSKYIYLNKPITVLFFNEVKERRSYYKMRLKAYVMDIRNEFLFKSEMTEILIRELITQDIINPEDVL